MTLGDLEWLGKYSTTRSIARPLCDSWATCSDSHDRRDFLSFHVLWQCYSVSMTSRVNIECMHGFAHRPKYRSRILDLSFTDREFSTCHLCMDFVARPWDAGRCCCHGDLCFFLSPSLCYFICWENFGKTSWNFDKRWTVVLSEWVGVV